MEDLSSKGFVLLKGVLTLEEVETAKKNIKGDLVDYTAMTKFIRGIMLPTVARNTGIQLEPMKYRVSDNNNSVDAGALHRDVFCVDPNVWYPYITCLTYMDKTVMELVPGSWKEHDMNIIEALVRFGDRVQVVVEPGDVLFFFSTLLHRGIFTEKLEHRRLIQVFDNIPTFPQNTPSVDAKLMHNTFVHVLGNNKSMADTTIAVSKSKLFSPWFNFLGYLNAATGHGIGSASFVKMMQTCGMGAHMFSSEGLCSRLVVDPGKWQTINKYIMLTAATKDMTNEDCQHAWRWACYTRQYVLYLIVLMVMLLCIVGVIIYLIVYVRDASKKQMPRGKNKRKNSR